MQIELCSKQAWLFQYLRHAERPHLQKHMNEIISHWKRVCREQIEATLIGDFLIW